MKQESSSQVAPEQPFAEPNDAKKDVPEQIDEQEDDDDDGGLDFDSRFASLPSALAGG